MVEKGETHERSMEATLRDDQREEKFRNLVDCYHGPIYHFFARRGFSAEECLSLTIEAFHCVYRGLEAYPGEPSKPWLYTIAANVYRDALRNRRAEKVRANTVLPEKKDSVRTQGWSARVRISPRIAGGEPHVRGSQVLVSEILDRLATGLAQEDVVEDDSSLEIQDVQAALACAADLARGARRLGESLTESGKRRLTADALLKSGLVGMWEAREDLGSSTAFARRLRKEALRGRP